jgi:ABC-2 type transport system permease protein
VKSQLWGLYVREVLRTFRNPFVLLITVVQPFMWLAFFGSGFAQYAKDLASVYGTSNYIEFLLPGVLSTSMLSVGMFGSMSTIQDKRFGFMKRILITPTSKEVIFLSKALGSATRGLIQIPVMIAAAIAFGVGFALSPVDWAVWVLGLLFTAIGFSSLFLAITARSTDWQTPGVVSNFITMPLMFSSAALYPSSGFPTWMKVISEFNPISYAATFGRDLVLNGTIDWLAAGVLILFGILLLTIGYVVSAKWLRVE